MPKPASKSPIFHSIEIVEGDITKQAVDAVVNAANTSLLGGGGVDGAIHRAAGPELLAECRPLGGCPTGQTRITQGYRLPARFVIHAVGPVYAGGTRGESELLRSCYTSALHLAEQNDCRTIAFPAISCGIYGYPMQEAARIALAATAAWLAEHSLPQKVRFVLFGRAAYDTWRKVYDELASAQGPDA